MARPLQSGKKSYRLNNVDKRITHQRLNTLKEHLETAVKFHLNPDYIIGNMTLTRYASIERRFRILLTAVDLLVTYINYNKNETKITSFRKSSQTAKRSTMQNFDSKSIAERLHNRIAKKRINCMPVKKEQAGFRYYYVYSQLTANK